MHVAAIRASSFVPSILQGKGSREEEWVWRCEWREVPISVQLRRFSTFFSFACTVTCRYVLICLTYFLLPLCNSTCPGRASWNVSERRTYGNFNCTFSTLHAVGKSRCIWHSFFSLTFLCYILFFAFFDFAFFDFFPPLLHVRSNLRALSNSCALALSLKGPWWTLCYRETRQGRKQQFLHRQVYYILRYILKYISWKKNIYLYIYLKIYHLSSQYLKYGPVCCSARLTLQAFQGSMCVSSLQSMRISLPFGFPTIFLPLKRIISLRISLCISLLSLCALLWWWVLLCFDFPHF